MGIQSLYAFNSAVEGLNKTAQDLANIQEARRKREQEDQTFQLDKQQKELNIKRLDQDIKSGAVDLANKTRHKQLQDQLAIMSGLYKADKNAKDTMIDQAEQEKLGEQQQLQTVLKTTVAGDIDLQDFMSGSKNSPYALDSDGNITFNKNYKRPPKTVDDLDETQRANVWNMAVRNTPKDPSTGKFSVPVEDSLAAMAKIRYGKDFDASAWEKTAQQIPQPDMQNVEQPKSVEPNSSLLGFFKGQTSSKTVGTVNKENDKIMRQGQSVVDAIRANKKVMVQDKNGKKYMLPARQLKDAQEKGFSLVE